MAQALQSKADTALLYTTYQVEKIPGGLGAMLRDERFVGSRLITDEDGNITLVLKSGESATEKASINQSMHGQGFLNEVARCVSACVKRLSVADQQPEPNGAD